MFRGLTIVLAVTLSATAALAQVVERNLPPAPTPGAPAVRTPPTPLGSGDLSPLAPSLNAIVLIGPADKVMRGPRASGIAFRVPVIDEAALRVRLSGFLGQPLSRRVIAEIQAAIADVYRTGGRPFVSVTPPPQEITGGILQLRLVEGRLGRVSVRGAAPDQSDYILNRVRLSPGKPIDARSLETDLDWLNRNPFRRVEAVFGPGRELAETELTLQTNVGKPWQVFAGYANSGSRGTDRNRYFAGVTASPFGDIIASYQATGSGDFWTSQGQVFGSTDRAGYGSHAGRLSIPLAARSSVDLTGNFVQTNEEPVPLFRFRTRTGEVSAAYRSAVSNAIPSLFGDWVAAVELKRQERNTFFTGIDVGQAQADVFQVVLGWIGRWPDSWGSNDIDVRVKVNPGGVLPGNNNVDWAAFSNGRVTDVQTAFVTIGYNRFTPLFLGTVLNTEVTALIGGKPLPDTERLALGGAQTVRGYVTEDDTVDAAVLIRNTLYFQRLSFASAAPALFQDQTAPFLFADVGYGHQYFNGRDTTLASVGAGIDHQLGPTLRSSFTVAHALADGAFTNAGVWRAHVRITASY